MTAMPAATGPNVGGEVGRRQFSRWWIYLGLTLGILLMVGPFLWMLLGSLKPQAEFLRTPPTFLPENPTTGNFDRLFSQLDFPRFFFNSALVAVAVTIGNVLFCPMLGYALAKLRWRGKRLVMGLVLATLMVPAGITLIPNFVLMSNLGLVNTYPGLILPFLVGPFGVFLTRQFMYGIPDELLEAARIDGANEWQIFWRVVIPQVKGTIITVFVTVLILVLKVFDIVYVLTNGNFQSNVIANLFFNELFANSQAGRASAIVVILLIAVLPVLYWQVRHFREEEANR